MPDLGTLTAGLESILIRPLPDEALGHPVSGIAVDSRQVVPGGVFVAVRGAKSDGHRYIADALSRGCTAIVLEEEAPHLSSSPAIFIRVTDSAEALGALAAAWYGYPAQGLCLIGITGTNGKTTCTWLIEGMLLASGCRPGVIGTVNYRYQGIDGPHVLQDAPLTTPDALTLQKLLRAMADQGVTHVVMEVSSHALEQKRLGLSRFDVALFTNLTRDHLDYHQDMERYFATKASLFLRYLKEGGAAVLVEAPLFEGVDWSGRLAALLEGRRMFRCGLSPEHDVWPEDLAQGLDGFTCRLHLGEECLPCHSGLTGAYNVRNILASAGVGLALGLPAGRILEGLAATHLVPGRLERVRLPGAAEGSLPAVFVDYAHTPDALENVLEALRPLTTGRIFCVFGCGGDRDRGKRPLMGRVVGEKAECILLTSDNPRTEAPEAIIAEILTGLDAAGKPRVTAEAFFTGKARQAYAVIPDRRQAIHMACALAGPGDSVLVAGKGHERYQIIGGERRFFDDVLEAERALMAWNKRHLLAASGGVLIAEGQDTLLGGISTDSRQIRARDIFVALRGEHFDGHAYIEETVAQGAAAVLAERFLQPLPASVLSIQVGNTLTALGDLAAYRRRLAGGRLKVCAITGSSGKTTVKELLSTIFAQALAGTAAGPETVLKTEGNFNNLVGLPLTLLRLDAAHRLAVVEMGMSAPGEIARLAAIADPDVGCINNIHPAHLQGLGSIEGVAAAKGELFAAMRPEAVRVANYDDPLARGLAEQSAGRHIGFAVSEEGCALRPLVRVTRVRGLGEAGMCFTLHIGEWSAEINSPLPGLHNISNCAAAAAMAFAAGVAPEAIASGLENGVTCGKRLAVSALSSGLKVVNDAYNANPASMAAGLRTVAAFGMEGVENETSGSGRRKPRHVAALGDMLELGPGAEALHREIGRQAALLGYDCLALTGDYAPAMADGALSAGMRETGVRIFAEIRGMAAWLSEMLEQGALRPGDWLLVKGSRGMRMETLIEELEGEGAGH